MAETLSAENYGHIPVRGCRGNNRQTHGKGRNSSRPDVSSKMTEKFSDGVSAANLPFETSSQVSEIHSITNNHPATKHYQHLQTQQNQDLENSSERRQLRATRRRCQQPKTLNSPEDSIYYNQLNGILEYQGSKRKPRKLGQIKVLDAEDEYYKLLSTAEPISKEGPVLTES